MWSGSLPASSRGSPRSVQADRHPTWRADPHARDAAVPGASSIPEGRDMTAMILVGHRREAGRGRAGDPLVLMRGADPYRSMWWDPA
ncbi:hypothetical protein GCM10023224_01910 [Streptomonospora halophila]|uniref:Uncharacterized protein n=1 Tax=Streptomonospora halophila TaxID=427369 RepID=A0ABP9G343_9ACTN